MACIFLFDFIINKQKEMIRKRRYGYGFSDFFREALDDMRYGFEYFPSSAQSYSIIGELVDTSKYDILPKKEYQEEILKQTEKQIEALDKEYKERRKRLVEEKENYTKALKQKNKDD